MNAIETLQPSRLPLAPAIAKEYELTPGTWRVLVEQTFPSAQSVEAVMMALSYCRQRNLDIFKKPVHIVPMWSSSLRKMVETVWPGIAEIRTTATRTGQYAGITAVEYGPIIERSFTGQIGKNDNQRSVTKVVKFPEWASVIVYRMVMGVRCEFHAKVFWEESYASTGKEGLPNDMWEKRPRGQLDKCVEAAALRKAFPEELGNIYAAEEMEGRVIEGTAVEMPPAKQPPAPPVHPATQQSTTVQSRAAPTPETVTEDGEMLQSEEFDAAEYFQRLEGWLAAETTVDGVEQVFSDMDPMSIFDGDDLNIDIAQKIKARRLKQIEVR